MKCDKKKFIELYETVYKDLYRFALCIMKDPHDAEDAVSEAVLNAYEHIGSLKKEEAFKSWIFTIVSNVCKKHLKKYSRERDTRAVLSKEHEESHHHDYDLPMDIRNALNELDEEERIILGMSVHAGYSSSEIGKHLNMNASTVRSKRSRALIKLSRHMSPDNESKGEYYG